MLLLFVWGVIITHEHPVLQCELCCGEMNGRFTLFIAGFPPPLPVFRLFVRNAASVDVTVFGGQRD